MNEILKGFAIDGELKQFERIKIGHINDTFLGTWRRNGSEELYVHQLINPAVFPNIPLLMDNFVKVSKHVQEKLNGEYRGNGDRPVKVVFCKDGSSCIKDPKGGYWRTYHYVDNVRSVSVCENEEQAYQAASALGRFQLYLSDLSVDDLGDTIPLFHHTPNRYRLFREAMEKDSLNRCGDAAREIEFVLEREDFGRVVVDALEAKSIPWRVTHNDPKINNVLFDESGKAVCVIDLDTCMPGTLPYDFGDLVRTTSVPAEEDETDLSKVAIDLNYFEALARGYLEVVGGICTGEEARLCAYSPKLLTLTIGLRFLTDHLNGDVYFRIGHENHNLERARNQFKVVETMEAKEEQMVEIVGRYSGVA